MQGYNVAEIQRFASRLNEQVQNSKRSFSDIDEGLRRITDIFSRYEGESSIELARQASEFASFWETIQYQIEQSCIKLAGSMMGFYEATSANQDLGSEEISNLSKKLQEITASIRASK